MQRDRPVPASGAETTVVQLEFDGLLSNPVEVDVAPTAPGIFSLNQSGAGQGAILNQDSSVNGPGNPERVGRALQIFLTGAGQTNPPGVDGKIIALTPPFPQIVAPVTVTIGGIEARTFFEGGAPGLIHGVGQINAFILDGVEPGDTVPLEVMIGDAVSQAGITVAVAAP